MSTSGPFKPTVQKRTFAGLRPRPPTYLQSPVVPADLGKDTTYHRRQFPSRHPNLFKLMELF